MIRRSDTEVKMTSEKLSNGIKEFIGVNTENAFNEGLSNSEVKKPYDLSVKAKVPQSEPEANLLKLSEADPGESLSIFHRDHEKIYPKVSTSPSLPKLPTPHIPKTPSPLPKSSTSSGVIAFSPKIVAAISPPRKEIAVMDKGRSSSPPSLKPTDSLDSLKSRSRSDFGTIWPKPLYPHSFLPYPASYMPQLSRHATQFGSLHSIQGPRPTWTSALLGGGAIPAATPLIPIHPPRIQMTHCFPAETNNFYEKPLANYFEYLDLMKENACTSQWSIKYESVSPISGPDSGESSKEPMAHPYHTMVSNSTSNHLTTTQPLRYSCADCSKSYATFSELSRHKQFYCVPLHKKSYKCMYCNKVYIYFAALKMHIGTHTLPYKCTICGKSFGRPWLLKEHIRNHTEEKPFSCPYCSQSFADSSNLSAHLQTHFNAKQYNCKSCNKTFSLMSLLMNHLKNNSCGERSNAN